MSAAPQSPVLEALEPDWREKQSVKECLRSKAMPSAEVKTVLSKKRSLIDAGQLRRSFKEVMEGYIPRIQSDMVASDDYLALFRIRQCATVFRFLQLLLEIKPTEEGENTSNDSSRTLAEANLNKMVLEVLRGLTNAVRSHLKSQTGAVERATRTTDDLYNGPLTSPVSQMTIYCIGTLIRMNHYVAMKPFLLSPLWKGLCDLAITQEIPSDLAHAAVKALCDHICEGVQPTLTSCESCIRQSCAIQKEQAFLAKILTFLLARLAVFLPRVTNASLAKPVLHVLCLLRGLGKSMDSYSSVDPGDVYRQISAKAEKALNGWLQAEASCTDEAEEGFCILHLIHEDASSDKPWKEGRVSKLAYGHGRTCLLLSVLEATERRPLDVATSKEDVESLLRAIQELIFRSLPLCFDIIWSFRSGSADNTYSLILPRTVTSVVASLIRCETRSACLATNVDPGRRSLHFLLVKWISLAEHPLSREVLLSIVALYIKSIANLGEDPSAFLALLVKLFFDPRTVLSLRRELASCLLRILQLQGIDKTLAHLLIAERKSLCQYNSKKHKRRGVQQLLEEPDLAVISLVLSEAESRALASDSKYSTDSAAVHKLSLKQVKFQVLMHPGDQNVLLNAMEAFLKGWKAKRRQAGVLGLIVLHRIYNRCRRTGCPLPDAEATRICQILEAVCTDASVWRGVANSDIALQLPLAAIRVLGSIGQALMQSTPKTNLQSIARSFHASFSQNNWLLRSYAMTSLVSFASSIPAVHQGVLPLCVPKPMQSLLQLRLQNTISCSKQIPALQSYCARILAKTCAPKLPPGDLLARPTSLLIESGSLIVNMPTQEGRSALVIFPPGEQSLTDIHFMLGMNQSDEASEDSGIQQLQYVVSRQDGSCKFLIR